MTQPVIKLVANDQGPAALPMVVENHNQQSETPTFTQDQGLTLLPNITALPNGHHGVSIRAATGLTEVKLNLQRAQKQLKLHRPSPP